MKLSERSILEVAGHVGLASLSRVLQLMRGVGRTWKPNKRRATMQLPEAAIAITLALGASGPETQC